jgi:hypothetical protein
MRSAFQDLPFDKAANLRDRIWFVITAGRLPAVIPNWAPATGHGPAGGAPAAGVGGGVPTERIPRDKPPNLARRGERGTKHQDTGTQTNTFSFLEHFLVNLPNHVLPLAHFGAISDVCD